MKTFDAIALFRVFKTPAIYPSVYEESFELQTSCPERGLGNGHYCKCKFLLVPI